MRLGHTRTSFGSAAWFVLALFFPLVAGTLRTAEPAKTLDTVSATDNQIQIAQDHVRGAPASYVGYDELGTAYFQKARETGDVSNFELAERALTKCLELTPSDFQRADALVHLSMVHMGEHRFEEALTGSQKAIALGAGNLAAFAIEGDALTDQGHYGEAAAAYSAARSVGETFASSVALAYMLDSRAAYLSFIAGDSKRAISLMKSAISAGMNSHVPGENIAWLYFELGERYFQTGDLGNAEASYRAGLTADANHYRSLAGLAKVRAAERRWSESIQLYQRSIDIVPFPQYVSELGDVYARSGDARHARQQYELVEYIGHLSKLNQVLANRELALFYADHEMKLDEALQLARKELELRQDIYTWDALAWVLYKNGRLQDAVEAASKALRLHTKDSLLLFHAGMIAHAAKDDSGSRKYLDEALELNPHFHVIYSDLAESTLADLNHDSAKNHNLTAVR